jgi:tRNA pseudouridine55 synthase
LTVHASGFLMIDKPLGLTSRAAVDHAARWFPRGTRLGHTGTLDPLATGALVIAVGAGTRLVDYVQRMEKAYEAGIRLGARSDTDDAEGDIISSDTAAPPDRATVESVLKEFVGGISQSPPAFSAAKVAGRRAYVLARRGADVDLAPRQVFIHEIRVVRYKSPDLELEVRCGKGTYIRSLARDLGERLGCGGYVQSLRRTRIGPFKVDAALAFEADAAAARQALLDLSWALADLPRIELALADAERFAHGQALAWTAAPTTGEAAVFDVQQKLVGVGRIDNQQSRPVKVFYHQDT